MSWIEPGDAGPAAFDAVFALRPELHARYRVLVERIWSSGLVDPALLELCRLRVAELLGCSTEAGAARRMEDWRGDPALRPVERACLAFAEKFVQAPHAVTDDDAAAVAAHLSPPAMIAFVEALALFDGFTRFRLVLGTT